MGSVGDLVKELRRRRVFREATVYIVVGWVVIQFAQAVSETWGISVAVIQLVWIGLLLGFPVGIIFAWVYDVSVDGIKRTPPAGAGQVTDLCLHRTDYILLSALAVVRMLAATVATLGAATGAKELVSSWL
jgi:adenylate cyclase